MTYYALQTPSGIVIPMGTKRPLLSKEDKKNFWKVLTYKNLLSKRTKQSLKNHDLTARS